MLFLIDLILSFRYLFVLFFPKLVSTFDDTLTSWFYPNCCAPTSPQRIEYLTLAIASHDNSCLLTCLPFNLVHLSTLEFTLSELAPTTFLLLCHSRQYCHLGKMWRYIYFFFFFLKLQKLRLSVYAKTPFFIFFTWSLFSFSFFFLFLFPFLLFICRWRLNSTFLSRRRQLSCF